MSDGQPPQEWYDEDMDGLLDGTGNSDVMNAHKMLARLNVAALAARHVVVVLDEARRALHALKQREGEDVDEWARRIADDVCEATDW